MFTKFLFPMNPSSKKVSSILLASRIIFGLLFMTHGLQKINNWSELSSTFADPLGFGSSFSLALAIFAELVCSIAFVFGILTRLALIPMMFTMIIAIFVIHGADPLASRELAIVYMAIFLIIFITGPGRYSIDWILGKQIHKHKR